MRILPLLLAGLLAAPSLAAGQSATPGAPAATAPAATAPVQAAAPAPPPVEEKRDPQFGLALTLGVADGAVLSFTWSPLWWMMLDAGFAYTLQPGLVVGLEFRPIDFFVAPIIRGEYGYYFPGRTADQIMKWAGVPEAQWPLVGSASYNWFSGLVGIAIGSRRGFTAALEGGIGLISLNVKGGSSTVNGAQVTTEAWKAQSFFPTARISFLYFF